MLRSKFAKQRSKEFEGAAANIQSSDLCQKVVLLFLRKRHFGFCRKILPVFLCNWHFLTFLSVCGCQNIFLQTAFHIRWMLFDQNFLCNEMSRCTSLHISEQCKEFLLAINISPLNRQSKLWQAALLICRNLVSNSTYMFPTNFERREHFLNDIAFQIILASTKPVFFLAISSPKGIKKLGVCLTKM